MSAEQMRKNEMMAHLLDSLDRGVDIEHYGRLVFAMVAQYFMNEDEFVGWLTRNPGVDEDHARVLWHQVREKGYSPPSREKVLEFQSHQEFPICPHPNDPDACNVYKDLVLPPHVYDHIEDFHIQKLHRNDD